MAFNQLLKPEGDTYAKIHWFGCTFQKLYVWGYRGIRQTAQVASIGNGAKCRDCFETITEFDEGDCRNHNQCGCVVDNTDLRLTSLGKLFGK